MPMTGFTITVRKSEVIDLDITIDQAIQFVVSCGVVVPPQQQQPQPKIEVNVPVAIAQHGGPNGDDREQEEAGERPDVVESSDSE